jgi:deazaflavin-dependent oxidoreductase (nitroreductase family)
MDLRETNRRVIAQFRAGGEIEGMHRERLVLLTTLGARTGVRHTTPMMFHRDGPRLLVVASNAGDPRDPQWYRNVLADPRVTVEVGDETYDATAVPLDDEDRERTWAMLKERYPFFADYETRVARTIPVLALVRPDGAAGPDAARTAIS